MGGFRDRLHRLISPPDDEFEDFYEDDEEETQSDADDEEYNGRRAVLSFSGSGGRNESRESKDSRTSSRNQVSVYRPTSFGEDTRAIADDLIARHTVVINLERADKETSRRIVDFLSGVAYANRGRLKPIASNIVIITPYNVDLSVDDVVGDLGSGSIYF